MADELKQIQNAALRLLARREHSQLELRNKLKMRGFNNQQVEAIVAELAEQGWLCDRRFAESYARQRIQKGYGPNRIAFDLRQNEIVDFDLDAIVHETAGNWLTVLIRVYEKKYKQEQILTRNEWAKRSRFLLQRGFTVALLGALFDHLNLKFE